MRRSLRDYGFQRSRSLLDIPILLNIHIVFRVSARHTRHCFLNIHIVFRVQTPYSVFVVHYFRIPQNIISLYAARKRSCVLVKSDLRICQRVKCKLISFFIESAFSRVYAPDWSNKSSHFIYSRSTVVGVRRMTFNCIHIFIVTGSVLYCCVLRPASQRFFIHSCIYLRILIITYLATFLVM